MYMDGANMNALVGVARPADFGVDVMHLNLHKTFSTPHGGGGPGSGPVAVRKVLEPYLPLPVVEQAPDGTFHLDYNRPRSIGRVRAFYGNFGMAVRALAYIQANGFEGLRQTTQDAVLNANYLMSQLRGFFDLASGCACHARMRVLGPPPGGARRPHRRHRQAAHRLRLSSLHHGVSFDCSWRADDRAHGERQQRGTGRLHRRAAVHCPGGRRRIRSLSSRRLTPPASLAWMKPPRRASPSCAGSLPTNPACDLQVGEAPARARRREARWVPAV